MLEQDLNTDHGSISYDDNDYTTSVCILVYRLSHNCWLKVEAAQIFPVELILFSLVRLLQENNKHFYLTNQI